MENPGLKKHTSTQPFLKVTNRRLAAPLMVVPTTNTTAPLRNPINPLDKTRRDNVQTPPPLMGGTQAQPVSATNGAEPILRNMEFNEGANQRRITQQKQVGGGAKENPAYDRAQADLREKMQVRRAHPLHQGAVSSDDDDEYWDGSDYPSPADCSNCGSSDVDGYLDRLHCYNCGHTESAPREDFGTFQTREFSVWDQAQLWGDHLKPGMEEAHPGSGKKILEDVKRGPGDITPLRMQHLNSHQGAQQPSDDPVYPYNPRSSPEHDTVDLDNLQSGDDSFRPQNPDVDRVMNHLQGLPDMSRNDPRLMEQVNNILDQYPDTEEGNRGADALSMGLNTIFDSSRETEGQDKDQRLQSAKDAIDAHFETSQLTHKQHVKQLHEDWEARGGHKTGEPRPVERFSPKYTKPQQIVPDPSNPFPELESPILYAGKCEGCGKKLYDSADSSGDPRGALGDHTLGTLDAAEYSATDVPKEERTGERRMHGPSALICPGCDSDYDRRNNIEDKYLGHKAGERSGGFHWTWQTQADGTSKNVRVDHTHFKDRKGKWHNPGEKSGSCYECDSGIDGFHRRREPGAPPKLSSADRDRAQMLLQMRLMGPKRCRWPDSPDIGSQSTGIDRSPGQHQDAYSRYTDRVLKKINHPLYQAHHDPTQDIHDVLDVQGSQGNWDYNEYMQGMFNGMELVGAIHDGRDPEFRSAPEHWSHEKITSAIGSLSTGIDVFPGRIADFNGSCANLPLKTAESSPEESDEEFWARMEKEHPGQQNNSPLLHSDDQAGQAFDDEEPHHDPELDLDIDDLDIPDNMSLRDHAHILRSGVARWDGSTRHPKYTHNVWRNIRDSDGNPAQAEEGHVIQHNTNHHGPVLLSDDHDEPAPHPLEYQWTHTYYPAGQSDDEGLVKGYNRPDDALHAMHQLSVWGDRHPRSQETLNGYQYIGSEQPYDHQVVFPHESSVRRLEAGLKDDFKDAFSDFTDWTADKYWTLGIPGLFKDMHEQSKALRHPDMYGQDGELAEKGQEPKPWPAGVKWKDIAGKPRHVRAAIENPGKKVGH